MTRNCTVALLLLGISGDLAAQTLIRVPQDKQSIQAGIDAANNGDTVLVTEGTYVENIVITKKITLAGLYASDGDTSHISKTVIDGSNPRHVDSASVVTFGVGTDTTSLLMGFTIRGGRGISAGVPTGLRNRRRCGWRQDRSEQNYWKQPRQRDDCQGRRGQHMESLPAICHSLRHR